MNIFSGNYISINLLFSIAIFYGPSKCDFMLVYPALPLLMEMEVNSFYYYKQCCRKHS